MEMMFPYNVMYANRQTFGKVENDYIEEFSITGNCPLIGSFKKGSDNTVSFVHDTTYDGDTEDNKIYAALYNIIKNYWDTAEIGFDDSFMFVKRFNAKWNLQKDKYFSIIGDYISHNMVAGDVTDDERSVNDENTLNNGYTDTAHRETESTLDHDGTSEVKNRQTYLEDGKSTLDATDNSTVDETFTRERNGKADVRKTNTEYNSTTRTVDDYIKYLSDVKLVEAWVNEFYNLFLEVI